MTDIQKYPGFVLRDMWIDGTLSDEDYSAEIARRVKIKTDKDALIRELVAAMLPVAAYVSYMHRKAYFDALAKAKEAGYEL